MTRIRLCKEGCIVILLNFLKVDRLCLHAIFDQAVLLCGSISLDERCWCTYRARNFHIGRAFH